MPAAVPPEGPKLLAHPLLRSGQVEARGYQLNIAATALEKNTLVILPTAMGKTVISLLVAAERLARHPGGQVLMLAPTKPLVLQHAESFKKFLTLEPHELVVLTGQTAASQRARLFRDAVAVFATPQGIRNDLADGLYGLRRVRLVIFDEAHRARRAYAYNDIARFYREQAEHPRVLALTASPGREKAVIERTCEALGVEAVELRSDTDADVRPYIPPLEVRWSECDMPPPYRRMKMLLEQMRVQQVESLQKMGPLRYKKARFVNKKDLLILGDTFRKRLFAPGKDKGFIYAAIVLQGAALSLAHMEEVLTTQDVRVLKDFLERQAKKETKGARRIRAHPKFHELEALVAQHQDLPHPKQARLKAIVERELEERPESRIIVFTQYRDTATRLLEALRGVEGARPVRFVGQASKGGDRGLSQEEQSTILHQFREGKVNILVATSIAEEGLDIPQVELVVFYEPVPSEIRLIQRRGRTARRNFGRVEILITRGTLDEAYYWSSRKREQKMKRIVSKLEIGAAPEPRRLPEGGQFRLEDFA
ncbi:MAG: DEAD/DEAH box helicase [Euryarchaeota archaeon]|nr:DEAD/DEAH box helicase [Euryarchaeota archaeon]